MGMPLNARMTRYTVSVSTTLEISVSSGNGKTVLSVGDEDIRIAYNLSDFDIDRYFTLRSGSTLVLDQPVPSQNSLLYVRASSGTSILEVWIT